MKGRLDNITVKRAHLYLGTKRGRRNLYVLYVLGALQASFSCSFCMFGGGVFSKREEKGRGGRSAALQPIRP